MRHASSFVVLVAVLATSAAAQDGIHWQPNLETAQQLAAQTNRLVLLHFWAPWCGPCMNLEKNVFNQPETGPTLEANYVLVKLNADESKAIARVYQVTTLPTDVIVTPGGRPVATIPCPSKAPQYLAQLGQAADAYKRQLAQGGLASAGRGGAANPYGAVQVSTAPAAAASAPVDAPQVPNYAAYAAAPTVAGVVAAPQSPSAPYQGGASAQAGFEPQQPPAGAAQNAGGGAPAGYGQVQAGFSQAQAGYGQAPAGYGQPPAGYGQPQAGYGQAPDGYAQAPGYGPASPAAAPPAAAAPTGPVDALDGYCCVTLVERRKWMKGDVRFGAIHRGKVYKFASQEAQQRFLANPDAFSPVLQGNDPVLALDARQVVAGSREHGLFYQGRIYLFTNEDSLKRFQASPNRYAAEVMQAMR